MLKLRIIPCLDVKDGRVVKGVNFVDLRDAGDPVEQAAVYDARRRRRADLPRHHRQPRAARHHPRRGQPHRRARLPAASPWAAASAPPTTCAACCWPARTNAASTPPPSPAPRWWPRRRERFGSQCVVAAVDARATAPGRWEVFTHGGRTPTGLDAVAWCRQLAALGAGEILLTSMDRDGTGAGFDTDLLRAVCAAVRLPVVASGGVGALAHFVEGAPAGATGLLAASVFHFGDVQRAAGQAGPARTPAIRVRLSAAGPAVPSGAPCSRTRSMPPMTTGPSLEKAASRRPPPCQARAKPATGAPGAEAANAQAAPAATGVSAEVLDRLWDVVQARRDADPASATPPACCRAASPRSRRNSARRRSSA